MIGVCCGQEGADHRADLSGERAESGMIKGFDRGKRRHDKLYRPEGYSALFAARPRVDQLQTRRYEAGNGRRSDLPLEALVAVE